LPHRRTCPAAAFWAQIAETLLASFTVSLGSASMPCATSIAAAQSADVARPSLRSASRAAAVVPPGPNMPSPEAPLAGFSTAGAARSGLIICITRSMAAMSDASRVSSPFRATRRAMQARRFSARASSMLSSIGGNLGLRPWEHSTTCGCLSVGQHFLPEGDAGISGQPASVAHQVDGKYVKTAELLTFRPTSDTLSSERWA
jgi:hypothetical protein